VKVAKRSDLPKEHACKKCGDTKCLEQIVVTRNRRDGTFTVRDICKDCHNEHEQGHRREYKRNYLRRWRRQNAQLNESYWRNNPIVKEKARVNAARRFKSDHEAILIQGRLNRHGMSVSLAEAKILFAQFGRCYPSRFGLTPDGLRECERIRSAFRRGKHKLRFSALDIRIMVYEDGLFIKPHLQPVPYRIASARLRQWHQQQREKVPQAA